MFKELLKEWKQFSLWLFWWFFPLFNKKKFEDPRHPDYVIYRWSDGLKMAANQAARLALLVFIFGFLLTAPFCGKKKHVEEPVVQEQEPAKQSKDTKSTKVPLAKYKVMQGIHSGWTNDYRWVDHNCIEFTAVYQDEPIAKKATVCGTFILEEF